ncbi:hypothetical protein BKA93DRAFT_217092 [Sparassis latifolia]
MQLQQFHRVDLCHFGLSALPAIQAHLLRRSLLVSYPDAVYLTWRSRADILASIPMLYGRSYARFSSAVLKQFGAVNVHRRPQQAAIAADRSQDRS